MEKSKLFKEDIELFDRMVGNYVSEKEKLFFETQKHKQEYVPTGMNDLVMHETSNPDHIYIVRVGFSEYIVGHGINNHFDEELHTMCLAEALEANLGKLGYVSRDITLLEWLRERDYEGVEYYFNYDEK
ncbi:MAG: hypothetical protein HUK01_05725 [Bacteroidaceae bacterium]|nr:hypothetical protein [Bacteroidaceae bacterium]